MQLDPTLEHFFDTLPERGYCTDDLSSGLLTRKKEQAIKKRYIQHNSPFDMYWLVYDIDRPTAHFDWQDLHAPSPTITATSPTNGHAHLFYGLDVPVLTCIENPKVRQSPFRYAAAIDVALTRKLEADQGYSGLISKNPLNDYWNVNIWQKEPYTLDWLADYVDLRSTKYLDNRTRLPTIGLGRNCTLFEYTRLWAYREIRLSGYLNNDFFIYFCTQYAVSRNAEFKYPLPSGEVRAIGKSVGKWVCRHFSPQGFELWRKNRAAKSLQVRKEKADNRRAQIFEYTRLNPKATQKEIADLFRVSEMTINRISELRIEYEHLINKDNY